MIKISVLVIVVYVVVCACGADFVRVSLTDTNKDAVCNDGSSATYFYRAGTGSGASVWTLYLEGGGWCFDDASCKERQQSTPHFTTSKLLPQVLTDQTNSRDVNHGGINSGNQTANPRFYNANQVYLWYCSSDAYAGNYSEPGGFHFKGKVIVQTLIMDIAKRYKDFANAKHVLLLGFSAGAIGVLNNADFVKDIVKSNFPSITIKAYMDSGWGFDTPSYDQDASNRDTLIIQYSNFKMQYNKNCMDVYARSGEQWRCSFAIYAYPHLETSLFLAGHQYDTPFLGVDLPKNATQLEYTSFMRKLFLTGTSPLKSLFAPNCWCHGVVAYDGRWNHIQVAGTTASEAVWQWLVNGVEKRVADTCQPINCNPTCSCIYNFGTSSFN